MSNQGSGSGGQRESSRLAKGKAVAYAPKSSPDTDDEYDAMEDPCTHADRMVVANLQRAFDVEVDGVAAGVWPPPRVGITIGGSTRSSGTPLRSSGMPTSSPPMRLSSKRLRAAWAPPSAGPILEDFVMPGVKYPPQGGIRPRYTVITPVADTPFLTNLAEHPSSSVHHCEVFTHFASFFALRLL